ncbi:FkbM family methyltransferase [Chlorogloea sp. CCALA 695]|uniref:FkbM family methyltransferase n=1 Tax=Chlorogloea sp. CCALA 695 TaxID=2107693 RepID=UPI000D069997|nr:FkbM family methyltransferase [Chlorogloea sp. CCALA 695]PSB25398.1 methyltransferase [Chlorogloea sp. CCALA 695]
MPSNSQPEISTTVLPNGIEIYCFQKNEEIFLIYEQVQEYFRHGIKINKGDIVFDVGANIGIFSLYTWKENEGDVNIYAFEPIAKTFELLEGNIKRLTSEKVKAIPCGLSNYARTEKFGFYPNTSSISTVYPDGSKEEKDKFKKAALQKINEVHGSKNIFHPLYKYTVIPHFMLSFILNRKIQKAFVVEQVTCQIKTLSEIIHDYKVPHINLLKIDVEKSELDVLLGIKPQDWTKIKQIVLEVHDLENRVETIKTLLASHGFDKVVVEQEPYLKGTDICNMYALRAEINKK